MQLTIEQNRGRLTSTHQYAIGLENARNRNRRNRVAMVDLRTPVQRVSEEYDAGVPERGGGRM